MNLTKNLPRIAENRLENAAKKKKKETEYGSEYPAQKHMGVVGGSSGSSSTLYRCDSTRLDSVECRQRLRFFFQFATFAVAVAAAVARSQK